MSPGFEGLTPESISFLASIRFNNNKPFFEENRALYERALRRPLLALARDLAPVMSAVDDRLDVRPERVVSRIYRDARYSKGIPYRDYMWLCWKPGGASACEAFSFYFYITVEACGWGLGFYGQCRDWMDAFRRRILREPEAFMAVAGDPAVAAYSLGGEDYKRPPEAPGLPESLLPWHRKKYFYLEKTAPHSACFDGGLSDRLSAEFTGLRPLYGYVTECRERISL